MTDTYQGGYGKALIDMMTFLDQYSDSLVRTRILTRKGLRALTSLLESAFRHRNEILLRPDLTAVWHNKDETFEIRVKGEKIRANTP